MCEAKRKISDCLLAVGRKQTPTKFYVYDGSEPQDLR